MICHSSCSFANLDICFGYRVRYRDLIGTAETIVAMNRDIQDVESILTDVGHQCNPRLIERKHIHVRQIKAGDAEKGMELTLEKIKYQ